jgi:hypothetical protein
MTRLTCPYCQIIEVERLTPPKTLRPQTVRPGPSEKRTFTHQCPQCLLLFMEADLVVRP